jgi:hypothetical protein
MENSMSESTLGKLLDEVTPANAVVADEAELMEFVSKTLESLQNSMASLHIGLRMMNTRVETLEKWVGFLMEESPTLGPKLKEMLATQAEKV